MADPGITSEVTQLPPNTVESQSRPRGVYKTMWGNTWWSMVTHNKKRIYLGTFATPEEAAAAYRRARAVLNQDSQ